MNAKWILITLLLIFSLRTWGYGVGPTTYPMLTNKKLLSTEITGVVSNGKGLGLQGRYTNKISSNSIVDMGIGFGGGDRTSRIFANIDYEIFPDYKSQPRISAKLGLENAQEFDRRKNILNFVPTVSKGFNFWGREAFPFLALPMGISLDKAANTYETMAAFSFGVNGKVPIEEYAHLTASFEAQLNLSDSFSALMFAVAFPID
ncbi:MAG: hypothetical protein OXB84_05390 [Halobacteriovoraceae bacterium]|nr:hypothetical protein [Halobacteriovoraceae bacterium]